MTSSALNLYERQKLVALTCCATVIAAYRRFVHQRFAFTSEVAEHRQSLFSGCIASLTRHSQYQEYRMPKWNETGYRGLLIQDVQAVRGGVSDVAARPRGGSNSRGKKRATSQNAHNSF